MKHSSTIRLATFAAYISTLMLLVAFAAPSLFGQCSKSNSQNCAYVTSGPGGDIYAVDRTDPLGSFTKLQTTNASLNDIRVATDNMLYATTNTGVLKLSESGKGNGVQVWSGPAVGPFAGIRFTPLGDAYVNTSQGVYRIGPDGNGKHLVQLTSNFPAPVQLTSSACTTNGGLAVEPTGDLVFACDDQIKLCHADATGVVSSCASPTTLQSDTGPITGLAVDALANVFYTTGNTVKQALIGTCSGGSCTTTTLATLAQFPAYIDTAPFPSGLSPSQAGSATPPCNSAAVTVFASTADGSSKNGTVSRIDTIDSTCAIVPTRVSSVLISTGKPMVGLGISSASRTLTETVDSATSGIFNSGPYVIEITPAGGTTVTPAGCKLSLTAQRESATTLDAILAATTPPTHSIPFNGEQSWRTSFHGGYPASGCTSSGDSHIGITGSLNYVNPWIVLIDDKSGQASIDPIPSVYPQFPLPGVPGDPIKITNSGLFTGNSRIVLVDRGFTVNNGQGFHFDGFDPPINEPTPDPSFAGINSINAGKSFVLKFTLDANGIPITDAQGNKVLTGISIARLTCDPSATALCVNDQRMLVNPTGNSATPPSFNFSSGQFHFNVDTNQPDGTKWCNGVYEATANSDSFPPHTVYFTITGAPAAPSCF